MYDSSKGSQDSSNIAKKIGCVGRIISNEETDEGRKNIILYGITRIKINEIIYTKPYRQAKIDIVSQTKSTDSNPLSKRITDLTSEWNLLLEDYNENYKIKIDPEASLSKLTDSLSSIVVTSTNERQWFLEETDEAKKRALKLIETLESRIDYLMGKIELPDKDSELIN